MNNRKLDIYLQNARPAVVVIETNDVPVVHAVCDYLSGEHHMKLIDYSSLQGQLIEYLQMAGQSVKKEDRSLCIYNFSKEGSSIDVIKSLNVSRELLRFMDKIVFVMPTCFVCEIIDHEPNLKDYIGIFLDYKKEKKIPFEPQFDVPFMDELALTKIEKTKMRYTVISQEGQSSLKNYYEYLSVYSHKKLSDYEMKMKLRPFYHQVVGQIKDFPWQTHKDYIQALYDARYQTATVLTRHNHFTYAETLFEQIRSLGETERIPLYGVQGLEGLSCCSFYSGRYDSAKEKILEAIGLLLEENNLNSPWISRLYNNYAACHMKEEAYQKARELLLQSEKIITETGKLNVKRRIRIFGNQLICRMAQKENWNLYEPEWLETVTACAEVYGEHSPSYAKCLMYTSWLDGIVKGNNSIGIREAERALNIHKEVLRENAFGIALNTYVLYLLYQQNGQEEHAMESKRSMERMLKNCRHRNEYLLEMIEASSYSS